MRKFVLIVFVLMVATMAHAQSTNKPVPEGTLIMGTGGPAGNYFKMGNDIVQYCKTLPISVQSTGGSVDNLQGMLGKQFDIGMVQEDVLQYFAKQDPREVNGNRLKIITGLHTEAAHLLVPVGYSPEGEKKGMWSSVTSFFSGQNNNAGKGISLELLKGQKIASWGGSVISAKALSFFMDLNWEIIDVQEKDRATISTPIFLVGGQPYKPIEDYLATGKYTLVPINVEELQNKAPFYMKDKLNYKVNGQVKSIPTFSVRAYLLGKSFRNEERNNPMKNLASCIQKSLVDMADDRGTSPLWASVFEMNGKKDGETPTNWPYFPIGNGK